MRKIKQFATGAVAAAVVLGSSVLAVGPAQEAEASWLSCYNQHAGTWQHAVGAPFSMVIHALQCL